ncbi:N-acetylmuramidase family protein [Gammaproteobacteria bacterium AS21]
MILVLGDSGADVKVLQHRLTKAGFSVIESGQFDEKTLNAVISFQHKNNLVVDGIVGNKTTSALLNKDQTRWLSQQDLEHAAKELDVDMASIHAIKAVESKGLGFLDDGRPKILYERHIMRRQLRKNGLGNIAISNAENNFPDLVNQKPGGYKGGAGAHYRLSLAKTIHENSALESCSWGLFQIMGFHWKSLGYKSVQEFTELMYQNEGNHWQAFIRFVKADKALHTALKSKNWAEFARLYNGPAYKKNNYDTKLASAYANYTPRKKAS